jgi:hypothetical protein
MIVDELKGIPQAWREFLHASGLVYDPQTQVDLLASALGSQFLLFAGPSGTGKSTAAKILSYFLTPPDRQTILDVRPAWESLEDVVGQYSAFTDTFLDGPATAELVRLAGTPESDNPHVMIVEEANLSEMEAYLGPVVTSASATQFERLIWPLHRHTASEPRPKDKPPLPPREIELKPWPRTFGTINVDPTATAPAPKVSGRACVVLLEPPEIDSALASTEALTALTRLPPAPPGAVLFGDPRRAWSSYVMAGDEGRFREALSPLLETLRVSAGNGKNVVSPRDVQRSVLYMAWHVPLAEAATTAAIEGVLSSDTAAAENAVLHFVLPGLSAEQFRRCLEPLTDVAQSGGLLRRRLERLSGGGEGLFGVPADFWASLS